MRAQRVVGETPARRRGRTLLVSLIGAVIGAWMSSGEPMTFTHYRRRDLAVEDRPRRVA